MGILYEHQNLIAPLFAASVLSLSLLARFYSSLKSRRSHKNLHIGSRGDAVMELQSKLRRAGCGPAVVDGIFGPHTECAVKDFQELRGLRASGVFDEKTSKELGWGI